ncbi:hypothetical protein C2W62_49940, partial [Candidatus Entotheonella serta]
MVNYLGRLPQAEGLLGDASPWSGVGVGRGADDGMSLSHVLSLNAVTVGNRLVARWSWASRHLSRADVEALSEGWQEALSRLAADAALPGSGGHTPSDFALVSLSQREIDLEEHHPAGVEAIWPLSPLQEGLLFHGLYDADGVDVYTVQVSLVLEGVLDRERLRQAADGVLRRHASLRARMVWEGVARPYQVIMAEA